MFFPVCQMCEDSQRIRVFKNHHLHSGIRGRNEFESRRMAQGSRYSGAYLGHTEQTQTDESTNMQQAEMGKRTEVSMARIDTDGLEEELRCACCYNPVKSETGCDGGCMVDGDEFNRIKDTIFKRIKKDDKPRWIPVTNGRGGHECSRCHEYAPCYQDGSEHLSAFCVLCGAKMERGEEE